MKRRVNLLNVELERNGLDYMSECMDWTPPL